MSTIDSFSQDFRPITWSNAATGKTTAAHIIVEDIRNVQSHINDALADLRETETGNGDGNVDEQALAHVASIDGRLRMERRFLSYLQLELDTFYPRSQGPAPHF
jgi:hypothetical protein